MSDPKPFDDILDLVRNMPARDEKAYQSAVSHFDAIKGPKHPLGRTERALTQLAGWQGQNIPSIARPLIAVFTGTHGVAVGEDGKNLVDSAKARVLRMTEGPVGVRGMASSLNAAFKVYEMGVEYPCKDIRVEASLTERDCAAAIAFGMEVVAEGADIIALGNVGYGAATGAAAIAGGLYGGQVEYWAGGTGDVAERRIASVQAAATQHRATLQTPLDILRGFGGRDIAGMLGAIIAARHQSIPVVLDGFVVCVAAAVLHEINPDSISHCLAGHLTSEPGHAALLERIGKRPLLELNIGVGDGTGAAFALGTLRLASEAMRTQII